MTEIPVADTARRRVMQCFYSSVPRRITSATEK